MIEKVYFPSEVSTGNLCKESFNTKRADKRYSQTWIGDKEWLDGEHPGNSEPFPATNLPVDFINSEQPGASEQFCKDQKVPYHQVWL